MDRQGAGTQVEVGDARLRKKRGLTRRLHSSTAARPAKEQVSHLREAGCVCVCCVRARTCKVSVYARTLHAFELGISHLRV